MKTKRLVKTLFLFSLLLAVNAISVFSLKGKDISKVCPLKSTVSTPIIVGNSNATIQVAADVCQESHIDYNIRDIVRLSLEPGILGTTGDTSVSVTVQIIDGVNQYTKTLYINTLQKASSSTYIKEELYKFNGSLNFQVSITEIKINGQSVSELPLYVSVIGEISGDRVIAFSGLNTPTNTTDSIFNQCESGDETIKIVWSNLTGAEEYQLEWTFINDYAPPTYDGSGNLVISYLGSNSLEYDFKSNSTRITTDQTQYLITNIFEHGYLLYRIRGVGRDMNHPDQTIYGIWSVANDKGLVSSALSSAIYNTNVHEGNKNWQYAATYAEEGKKKEVISYFDGSLRNRQSVTRTNTDSTVIVGQTIYDYQGRPAINVLPVPVSKALQCEAPSTISNVIKYYERFNRDNRDSTYSSYDFDNYASSCNLEAGPMNTNSGASNYYSPLNPDKNKQQAYLPDAHQYPFTQIQYTPDNTGRVIKQSGVGESFKLGSGKEIVNYYGQPNQIQLDRMFGSEAGHVAHYKKNLVFDANGQASVSYLNQEGKVVATSLTGAAPDGINPLPSEINSRVPLTINLFGTNNDTTHRYLSADRNSLIFGTTILVPEDNSPYTFNYDVSIPDYTDTCMNIGICFGCVYDLKIKITDGCGNIVPKVGGDTTYANQKMIGNFELNNDTVRFLTTCTGTFNQQLDSINLMLSKGNYRVDKILSINQDALSFYVSEYTDTTKNHCLKTYGEFVGEAMSQIDLTSCNISCESCLEALGSRQEWLDSARGTALEWDIMYEKCIEPCQPINVCEATYDMLLMDVSVNGQYAQYLSEDNGILTPSPSLFPLSVLNESNSLGNNANWRHPKVKVAGNEYPFYLDANGSQSKIGLTMGSNGVYTPEPAAGVTPMTGENGEKYIYPQQLKKLEDFVSRWDTSWAKSLVTYHPEYCFYTECSRYSIKYPGFEKTSADFDMLLNQSDTYQDAIDNKLVDSVAHTVYNIFDYSATHAYDPYLVLNSPYSTSNTNRDYMSGKWLHYTPDRTMEEIASYIVRFGTYYGATLGDTAYQKFGTGDVNKNNAEWALFKSMYLTEKQKIQQQTMSCVPLPNAWYTSNNKVRRFNMDDNLPEAVNTTQSQTDADIYSRTGQCPLAFEFTNFISEMASSDSINHNNVSMVNYPIFSLRLYELVRGSSTNPFVPVYWTVDNGSTPDNLIIKLKDNSTTPAFAEKTIVINKAGTGINWNDFDGIQDIHVASFDGTYYQYTAYARIYDAANSLDPYSYKQISGYTDINIGSCSFQDEQTPNSLSVDLHNLWNQLIQSGTFNSQTPVPLDVAPYQQYLTHNIQSLMSYAPDLQWIDANNGDFYIYGDNTPNIRMVMRVNHYTPDVYEFDSISHFGTFSLNNQAGFEVDARRSGDTVVTHLSGYVFMVDTITNMTNNISLGNIGFHTPSDCIGTQFQLRDDLEYLLKGITVTQNDFQDIIATNHLDSSYYYTSLIDSVFRSSSCTLMFNTHLIGVFDSIHITGNLVPTGEMTSEGLFSNFYMLANYYLTGNDNIIIHDTLFGGSPCLRINSCSCPLITEKDVVKWNLTNQFSNCMDYADSISEGTNPVNTPMINSLFECMNGLNIDSTGGGKCLGLPAGECELCLKQMYLVKSQNWLVSDLDNGSNNFVYIQDLIPLVENGTINTSFYLPSISYYGENEMVINESRSYLYYQKRFTVDSPVADLDFEIKPYNRAYLFINNVFVDSLVNKCEQIPGSFHVRGYGNLLHQGENVLNIIYNNGGTPCNNSYYNLKRTISISSFAVRNIVPCAIMPDTIHPHDLQDSLIADNQCEKDLIATAMTNAQNSYNEYMSAARTDFISSYREHCMQALENFTYHYTDKEYHFTLYYYDQAGNLVKTIPPEGVELLPVTSDTDPLEVQINADRDNNIHTVFTNHRMETRYEYNSLNQLVKQVTPDHDKMNIWELTMPNGLPKGLQITSSYFIDGSEGFITGYIAQNGRNRGVLYSTYNSGANWTKVNDLVASDFQRIQFVGNTGVGYAVGKNGTVLKTIDQGISWDLLPLYVSGITSDIQGLYFKDAQEGIIVAGNNHIYKTTNGGDAFTAANVISVTGTIQSVSYFNSNYYIALNKSTANFGSEGQIYTSADGITWSLQTENVRTKNLSKVRFAGNTWYAVGEQGGLLTSTDGNTWTLKPCETTAKINDIWFNSANVGVALIEDASGKNKLMSTYNGGLSWSILGNNVSSNFNALNFYRPNMGYAVGEAGVIQNIVFTSNSVYASNFTHSKPRPFFDKNILGVHANTDGDKIWLVTADTLYMGNIDSFGQFVWTQVDESATQGYKNLYFNYQSNAGLFLKNDGSVIKVNFNGVSVPTTISKEQYSVNIVQMQQRGTRIVAIDNSGATKYALTSNFGTDFTSIANGTLALTNIVSLDFNGADLICVGNSGNIFYSSPFSATPVSWTDKSSHVIPLAINSIYSTGSVMYAAGSYGSLMKSTDGLLWKSIATPTILNLNAVKFASNTIFLAGDNGFLATLNDNGTQITQGSVLDTYTQKNLYDFAVNTTADIAYAVGANGTLVYLAKNNNVWTTLLTDGSGTQNYNYRGVAFNGISETDVVVVGQNSAIYNYSGVNGMKNRKLFTSKLNSIHFADGTNGYLVGDAGFIRHTTDVGLTWSVVLPQVSPFHELKTVIAVAPNVAVVAGESGYIAHIASNTSPSAINLNLTDNINVLKIRGAVCYLAGDNGILYKSTNGGNSWQQVATGVTNSLRAIHIFSNSNCVVAGDQSFVGTYKYISNSFSYNGKASDIAASTTLNDVYFHDDRNGYAVGNGGAIYKCYLTDNAFDSGVNINWITKPIVDDNGITVSNSGSVNINTIAFPSRYNGFIGGVFNDILPNNRQYARLLHDESELYSTYFWYDRLGRMVVSRNTKQFNKQAFSYTLYDALGRIKEVGEITEPTNTDRKFNTVFGDYVNNLYNPKVINDSTFNLWILANTRAQVTRTFYDYPIIVQTGITQQNLRKRVATATYSDAYHADSTQYDYATHYSYDIHGNVNVLWQDNPVLATVSGTETQRFKRIDYDYDLVSGKVNEVKYQAGQPDQFIHRYEYDADNRIIHVQTSKDGVTFDNDASYTYYKHGPLARVEVGNEMVQGIDYAYTLQGWIKGVNSNSLNADRDMGTDGKAGSANVNVARDAFGYSLNYFNDYYTTIDGQQVLHHGDYTPIDPGKSQTTNNFIANTDNLTNLDATNLYNGNIKSMVTTIRNLDSGMVIPQITGYKYDQLNRIMGMKAFAELDTASNIWAASAYNGRYQNEYTYDANGNIDTLRRKNRAGVLFDDFVYSYEKTNNHKVSNRLYHVNDGASSTLMADDIDDEGVFTSANETINSLNNYSYDEIGNLQRDSAEGIQHIEWTAYGKIKSITRRSDYTKTVDGQTVYPSNLEFRYDATGNRIAKIEKPRGTDGLEKSSSYWITTYYVRDATGNPMGTYKQSAPSEASSFKLIERPIYGSSRVGIDNIQLELFGYTAPTSGITTYQLGLKQYELVNHLGNVLSTVTDKKIPHTTNGTDIDYYLADITSATDYYPFGSPMDGRTYSSDKYRFGFNGKEKDDELKGEGNSLDFGGRIYDSRLGRWLSLDPLQAKYPSHSPYTFVENSPLWLIDKRGDSTAYYTASGALLFITHDKRQNAVVVVSDENLVKFGLLMYHAAVTKTVDNDKVADKARALGDSYLIEDVKSWYKEVASNKYKYKGDIKREVKTYLYKINGLIKFGKERVVGNNKIVTVDDIDPKTGESGPTAPNSVAHAHDHPNCDVITFPEQAVRTPSSFDYKETDVLNMTVDSKGFFLIRNKDDGNRVRIDILYSHVFNKKRSENNKKINQ